MNRRRIGEAIIGILVWVVLVVVTSFITLIPPPWGVVLATGAGLLSFRYSDRLLDLVFGKEKPEQAILDLEPLPHYKGYLSPPPLEERKLADAKHEQFGGSLPAKFIMTHPVEYTHPDAKFLRDSQSITIYRINPYDEKYNKKYATEMELIVKFGVIQVRSLSGDVIKCKADTRFRTLEVAGKQVEDIWLQGGYLNWFSPELNASITPSLPLINAHKLFGINKYLLNTEQDITQNQTKDLLLFYMIKDIPNLFLCSSIDSEPMGTAENNYPVKFEVEITLTGEGYPATVWRYRVKALWDDFEIIRVG